jgi:uncharacterized protein (TIGR00159 family)
VSFLARTLGELKTLEVVVAIADIALVYYVVYRALLLIKGTRAVPMLIGLLLIILAFFLSEIAGLATLNWLLNNFFNALLLVVIVVFQQDIRRGLTRIGMTRLFQTAQGSREQAFLIEELVKASTALAAKKIGAIIVVERTADVSEFVEEGTKLDALVTKELLYSIFIPELQNPVHDGAVVVKHGRLASAGAFLPLSQNPALDRTLGTRHRAAIGLTEQTDAVCIVVSEERGSTSLCFDGNIARDLDGGQLRKALQGLLADQRKAQPGRAGTPAAVPGAARAAADRTNPGTPSGATRAVGAPAAGPKPARADHSRPGADTAAGTS